MRSHGRFTLQECGPFEFDGEYIWIYASEALARYRLPDGEQTLRREMKYPKRVLFPPGRDFGFLARSFEKVVERVEPATLARIESMKGHRKAITAVALSADGSLLASAAEDRTIRLWDVDTLETVRELEYEPSSEGNYDQPIDEVRFVADGRWLCSVGSIWYPKPVVIWDVATGERAAEFVGSAPEVRLADDALYVRVEQPETYEEAVYAFDFETGEAHEVEQMPPQLRVERILGRRVLDVFARDGAHIARLGPFDEVDHLALDTAEARLGVVADGSFWWWSVQALAAGDVDDASPQRQIVQILGVDTTSAVQRLRLYKAAAAALGVTTREVKSVIDARGVLALPDASAADRFEEAISGVECLTLHTTARHLRG